MTYADEFAEQYPTISTDTALKITGEHLSRPFLELAAAIADGDVIQPERNRVDTESFLSWLGY